MNEETFQLFKLVESTPNKLNMKDKTWVPSVNVKAQFAPGSSVEGGDLTRPNILTTMTVYVKGVNKTIAAGDRILYNEEFYDIEGRPKLWTDPMLWWNKSTVFDVKLTEGI